jgi:hypothetical protein
MGVVQPPHISSSSASSFLGDGSILGVAETTLRPNRVVRPPQHISSSSASSFLDFFF